MATRHELLEAIRGRYLDASREGKRKILDELVEVSGYHRKHAIRLLRAPAPRADAPARVIRRIYGDEVREALIVLWEMSDRICGKRLKPLIPVLLPALERHGRVELAGDVRDRVLEVSAATIDRLLCGVRMLARGGQRRRAGFSSAVRRTVPVRTFNDWHDPPPGFVEVDFVAHAGESAHGSFVQTLVLTDIATGWTECIPVVVRESALVVEALRHAQTLFPFRLRGVDFDNDSAFMNDVVVGYCREKRLEVTRSRAYRKNDQAWVEQKNGAVVRRLVGYGRFEGLKATETLARLFAAARLQVNVFLPSFKLRSKTRIGARVVKRYDAPLTPLERVLAHPAIDTEAKTALRHLRAQLDPVMLLSHIRASQAELGSILRRRIGARVQTALVTDLPRFVDSLEVAWKRGEVRPTHRRAYIRRKPVPRRPKMFDAVREELHRWLADEPGITAIELLQRLQRAYPDRYPGHAERTMQREVRQWRSNAAKHVIFAAALAAVPRPTTVPLTR